ncbi:particle protein [Trabzonvirus APT65]|uniref:Particle protein n=1 Tax=Aeromonas phage APT65 TaxID=2982914 RepID=A0A9E8GAG7_9CAUD|nr:particle protein [Aeromonas phage APT65]
MRDINTYGDLKEAVQLWLNRKDSVTINNIPMFINMASKEFTRLVKLPYYEVLVSLEALEGFNYVNIPQDFLSAKHVSVNGIPYNRVDVETYLRLINKAAIPLIVEPTDPAIYINGATLETKYFFTRIGGQLKFIPELIPGDIVEMIYQRDIPEFNDDNEEPYTLLVASDVMLYLSLRHASIFLRDPEQEQYWAQKANDAAVSLMKQLDDAEWSGSSLVVPMFTR